MALHINVEDLLSARTVETDRIEYKEGWNPDAIYRSICAFANDYSNTGGGYILIGVVEDKVTKTAVRPVKGLTTAEIGTIQQKMISLNNLINPVYNAKCNIEEVDGKQIIVLWVPGGSNRPYQVPELVTAKEKRYFYYIRRYANSVKVNLEEQQELISLANQVPFDDRPNLDAKVENISMVLVKDYLEKIQSKLAEQIGKKRDTEVLDQMELLSGPDEHVFPRNVGLMMFAENPDKYFPFTQVDIVEFPDGEANPYFENEPIKGPVPVQIKRTLDFLKDKLIKEKVTKPSDSEESIRISTYPYQAIEETLVNAFYHRDYQKREPIEIRIYPNSICFINQGGPDRSIRLQAFNTGLIRSRRYRNRRLGEFLKELELTEGRATGIPTILKTLKENGSPAPQFNTDDDRTFFEVELFIHPEFKQLPLIKINVAAMAATREGINKVLDEVLTQAGTIVNAKAGTIVGAISTDTQTLDFVSVEIIDRIPVTIAGTIADTIADTIVDKDLSLLKTVLKPVDREFIMSTIGLKNLRKNYEKNVKHLVDLNWITMTIPGKPTSSKQQYLTTLKGRLILEFLKHKTK